MEFFNLELDKLLGEDKKILVTGGAGFIGQISYLNH